MSTHDHVIIDLPLTDDGLATLSRVTSVWPNATVVEDHNYGSRKLVVALGVAVVSGDDKPHVCEDSQSTSDMAWLAGQFLDVIDCPGCERPNARGYVCGRCGYDK